MTEAFEKWIGRSETDHDLLEWSTLRRLAALLDYESPPWERDEGPALVHWLCFLPTAPQSCLDEDGHPRRGGFLPPIELPQRMWAGSRIDFVSPVPVGVPLQRCSTISDIKRKQGRSGEMIFVIVRHVVSSRDKTLLVEEQDIVYRDRQEASHDVIYRNSRGLSRVRAPTGAISKASSGGADARTIRPDTRLLFRFSALTFNAHRIHYDAIYARAAEHYPGLVVQGPLTAMLLMDAWRRKHPQKRAAHFSFQAKSPLFVDEAIRIEVTDAEGASVASALNKAGIEAMQARIVAA